MKVCTKCGQTKPLDEFRRDKRRPDGRGQWCNPCNSESARAWYRANPDKAREQNLRARPGLRHRLKESGRRSDYVRAFQLRQRGVTIVEKVPRRVVFDRAGGRCQQCGTELTFRGGDSPWHLDHIVPVGPKYGGEHSLANAQALCLSCHKAKTAREQAKA